MRRWLVRKSENPYTEAKLSARSVTNRPRPPNRRILSENPVGRAVAPNGGAAKQRPRGRAVGWGGEGRREATRDRPQAGGCGEAGVEKSLEP